MGFNLLWKKPQKNLKKKSTSEVINKIIPQRKPFTTFKECSPWYKPSRTTSRHHWALDIRIIKKPIIRRFVVLKWNIFTRPVVVAIAPIEAVKGHGLLSTR